MILLLDTHILLWWLADSPALPKAARRMIQDGSAAVFVSAATAWEIAVKKALGKLETPDDLEDALAVNGFERLPISVRHALAAGRLPHHHEDPFDRMLLAQAQCDGLTLITHDRSLTAYGKFVHAV